MQKRLVHIVNSHCLRRLGTLPALVNPTGYNDKLTTYRFKCLFGRNAHTH